MHLKLVFFYFTSSPLIHIWRNFYSKYECGFAITILTVIFFLIDIRIIPDRIRFSLKNLCNNEDSSNINENFFFFTKETFGKCSCVEYWNGLLSVVWRNKSHGKNKLSDTCSHRRERCIDLRRTTHHHLFLN